MSEIETLISDFKHRGWESEPMDKVLDIAHKSAADAARLAHRLVDELPKGSTFFDAVLSFVPLDEWPELVRHAIAAFAHNKDNESAEAVFRYGSLQCVRALHPHLRELFDLAPNADSKCEEWPWRAADSRCASHLLKIITAPTELPQQRRKAWMCMLETRDLDVIRSALKYQLHVDLNLQRRKYGLPDTLTAKEYLHDVGFEEQPSGLRQLFTEGVRHLVFDEDYFDSSRPAWLRRSNHPTWISNEGSVAPEIEFGGDGRSICGRCGNQMHRLLHCAREKDLPRIVNGLETLTLETCLSCLGWEQQPLFYRHVDNGLPTCLSTESKQPEFPAIALKPTIARLIDHGERWCWQDWGCSNSRENLNRIGGHPTWVQSSEYPQCPDCKITMRFLLQLDSDFPNINNEEWLWGSGGILYAFWCNSCRISGLLWQCT
jgi:hypothetical protein